MKIYIVNISFISIFISFFLVLYPDFFRCVAFTVSQLKTQRVIMSQIRSHIKY